jgi:hypothetical protein
MLAGLNQKVCDGLLDTCCGQQGQTVTGRKAGPLLRTNHRVRPGCQPVPTIAPPVYRQAMRCMPPIVREGVGEAVIVKAPARMRRRALIVQQTVLVQIGKQVQTFPI